MQQTRLSGTAARLGLVVYLAGSGGIDMWEAAERAGVGRKQGVYQAVRELEGCGLVARTPRPDGHHRLRLFPLRPAGVQMSMPPRTPAAEGAPAPDGAVAPDGAKAPDLDLDIISISISRETPETVSQNDTPLPKRVPQNVTLSSKLDKGVSQNDTPFGKRVSQNGTPFGLVAETVSQNGTHSRELDKRVPQNVTPSVETVSQNDTPLPLPPLPDVVEDVNALRAAWEEMLPAHPTPRSLGTLLRMADLWEIRQVLEVVAEREAGGREIKYPFAYVKATLQRQLAEATPASPTPTPALHGEWGALEPMTAEFAAQLAEAKRRGAALWPSVTDEEGEQPDAD